jgi:hypothetical protein
MASDRDSLAYEKMKRQAETIMTVPTDLFSSGFLAVPTLAKTNNHAACQIPPMISGWNRYQCQQLVGFKDWHEPIVCRIFP